MRPEASWTQWGILALGALLISACGAGPAEDPGAAETMAAETIIALQTQTAAAVTETPHPPTETSPPTETPVPSDTPLPTNTPVPTATPIPANWAGFVRDVTIEDGTTIEAGEEFVKIWRFENVGTETWTPDYSLVFISGDRMGGERIIDLDTRVEPNETVDVSVRLEAPEQPGRYKGFWAFRTDNGLIFGLGPRAQTNFWVDVRVKRTYEEIYDFDEEYCFARWRSGAGVLDCPGEMDDDQGFVMRIEEVELEDDVVRERGSLLVSPEMVDRGEIWGTFPEMRVREGDRFRATVACRDRTSGCRLTFRLEYITADEQSGVLYRWKETFDEKVSNIDVDLSELAGRRVNFVLMTRALRDYNEDLGVWVAPSIWR